MQVNSVSFKGLNDDYANFKTDMRKSLDAINGLKGDLFKKDAEDEFTYVDDEPKKKNFWGVLGSLAFISAAAFFVTRKAYKGANSLIDGIKKLPEESTNIKNILDSKAGQQVTKGFSSVKDQITGKLDKLKGDFAKRIPDVVKNNAVTKFVNNLAPATKVGLAGAAAGTIAASKIDNNENGYADMFENGISVVDGIAEKAGKIMDVAKVLS